MGRSLANESELRWWLRGAWQFGGGPCPPLAWVEAAPGGTDGTPDVFLPIGELWLPVELKDWSDWKVAMRPVQKRFHRLALEASTRTAFLFLAGGEPWLICGRGALDGQLREDSFPIHEKSRAGIVSILKSKEFWS